MKKGSVKSRRSACSRNLLLAAPALAGASMPAGHAAIIYTNVTGGLSANNLQAVYFDMESGAYSLSTAPGMDFALYFDSNDSEKPAINGLAGGSSAYVTGTVFDYSVKFSHGAAINSSSIFATKSYLHSPGGGQWPPPTNGYVGLKLADASYGWANVTYDGTLVTLYGFAYENTGSPILAGDTGVVPEPAETALFGALAAGSAAAFAARRKRLNTRKTA